MAPLSKLVDVVTITNRPESQSILEPALILLYGLHGERKLSGYSKAKPTTNGIAIACEISHDQVFTTMTWTA